jgi:hypothetical protein
VAGKDPETVDAQELALFLRQQHIEPAALPPEIKRAVFTDLWDEYVIQVKRTAKVTKSGRLQTSHVLLVVGNMDGLVGVGSASGSNLQQVMMSALAAAYRNIVPIARYRWVNSPWVGCIRTGVCRGKTGSQHQSSSCHLPDRLFYCVDCFIEMPITGVLLLHPVECRRLLQPIRVS